MFIYCFYWKGQTLFFHDKLLFLFLHRPAGSGSHLAATSTLSPSTIGGGSTLTRDSKENMDANAGKVCHFEHPTESMVGVESTNITSASAVTQTRRCEAPLKVESLERLSCSSSSTSLV